VAAVSVLDPATPWPWLLYALAGAGLAAYVVPEVLNSRHVTAAVRETFRAHPPAMAFMYVVMWAIWPFLAAIMLIDVARGLWWRLRNWIADRRNQSPGSGV
jgi:hypothetical protein